MRKVTKKIRKSILYRSGSELKSHIWFRYHRALFVRLILKGQKIKAFNKLLDLKFYLKMKENIDPNLVFLISMLKATPIIFLLPVRLGSFTQGVPMPISEKKQVTFTIKWLINASKLSPQSLSMQALANSLVDTIYDRGIIFDKKLSTYDEAIINRHLLKFYK